MLEVAPILVKPGMWRFARTKSRAETRLKVLPRRVFIHAFRDPTRLLGFVVCVCNLLFSKFICGWMTSGGAVEPG